MKKKPIPAAVNLRAYGDAVLKMNVGEQFMGARDVMFHSATRELAEWIESVEERLSATHQQGEHQK